MAVPTDRLGQSPALGDVYLLAGKVRRIETDDLVVVTGIHGRHAMRVEDADVVKVDDLHGIGYFQGPILGISNAGNPLTTLQVYLDDLSVESGSLATSTYRIPIVRSCSAAFAAIRARTFTDPPPTWTLQLYRDGLLVGTRSVTFGVYPTFGVSAGPWTVEEDEDLDFAAGAAWHCMLTGTAINACEAIIQTGWTTQ